MSIDPPSPALGTVLEVRVLSGTRVGEQFWFFDAEKVKMGRNPANDVVLPDGVVSRFHAELVALGEGRGYKLCDQGSMAGTYLGSSLAMQRINADSPMVLIAPGAYELCFGRGGPRVRVGLGSSVPFGRYRLIARLGGGGMAEVYLARQMGLGGFNRPVAIKLIQPEMFEIVDATAMFLDEARIAAEINHHNVVKIYDVGEQDGVLFLAMEHVRGATLSNLAAQLAQRGERIPPDLVAALISQACAGLHAAHSLRHPSGRLLNVVHRDVSPSNLMCTAEGLVKVIDFGVARADTRLVRKEEGLQGKPAYMSPEQIQGQPLDGRSDVFAIGVVLYELCSGQPLFQRDDTVATFYAVVRGEVPPLRSVCPQVSPLLEMVVHKALAKDPAQRFQSAADLAAELDQVVQEAGGRFANISAVARFLAEWGVNLSGPAPLLLTQLPKPLVAGRDRIGRVDEEALSTQEVAPAPSAATAGATGLAEIPSLVSTVEPGESAAPSARRQARMPHSAQQASLLRQPQRLEGITLEGRYRIIRWLGHSAESDSPYPKLYYLAEVTQLGPAETAAHAAGLLEGTSVLIVVCGRGADFLPLTGVQRERLVDFAARRALPGVIEGATGFLLPVLFCGIISEPPSSMPSARAAEPIGPNYLVVPHVRHTLHGLLELGPLPMDEALDLARQVAHSLAEAVRRSPGDAKSELQFVHGSLSPASFGLCPPKPTSPLPPSAGTPSPTPSMLPHRVVLLDFRLETILGAPPTPLPTRETLPIGETMYLAPERLSGGPPTAAADVYAIGAVLYQILGGDLQRATAAVRARREPPLLSTLRGLASQRTTAPHVEAAVLAALRYEPSQRPDAQRLCALLEPEAAAEPKAKVGLLRLTPPAAGARSTIHTSQGRELVLHTIALRAPKQHTTLALPWNDVPMLLPAPIAISAHGTTLMVQIEGRSSGRGRDRPSLYQDAYDPNSRCESYTLLLSTPAASFDIGHRRATVQRVFYASGLPETPTAGSLRLPLYELQVEIDAPGSLLRVCTLYTTAGDSGLTYVVCILIQP